MLESRCELNPRAKLMPALPLKTLGPSWNDLNLTFRKFENLTIATCDNDAPVYANKFQGVLREFKNLKLTLDETHKIYRFHSGLLPTYSSYVETYNQNHHNPFGKEGHAEFDLDYAITRFLHFANDSTVSTTAQSLAGLVPGTDQHTQQSTLALIASGKAEFHIQPGAHAGNSRVITHIVKFCSYCNKDYHDASKCNDLHPERRKRDKRTRRNGRGHCR
jgi:hypothetical protein